MKIIFGGMNIPDNTYFNDVWLLDIRKVSDDSKLLEVKDAGWIKVNTKGETPLGRKGHMACYCEKNMIVFGGDGGVHDQKLNDIHVLDTELWNWKTISNTSNNITSRSLFSACQFEDQVLVFGGLENHSNDSLNEVLSLNLIEYQFNHPFVAGEYPLKRYGHASCLITDDLEEDKLFILGGINTDYCTMDIHFLKKRDRKPNQTWERIVEKNDFEDKVMKTANNYIFENIKYLNVLKDLTIEEKSLGIEITKQIKELESNKE